MRKLHGTQLRLPLSRTTRSPGCGGTLVHARGSNLTQADAEAVARSLIASDVRVVGRPEKGADAFVINTCSVTHVSDRKARHLARLARRLPPSPPIVLPGCHA